MDYEKKYKEALGWMQSLYNGLHGKTKEEAERYFPELKESEDERIRKALIGVFSNREKYLIDQSFGDITVSEALAWLEKQGEQKLSDKVEPKFKICDWVVHDMSDGRKVIRQIIGMTDKSYILDGEGSNTFYFNDLENDYHLWTIQDAKDGDVLCCENGWTCIFKALDSDISFSSYCFMDSTGWFCETGSESHTLEKAFIKAYSGNIYPATKEQRDLLFQKIHEAGYEWDTEKKELTKIEQSELTEFEEAVKDMMDDYRDAIDAATATTEEVKEHAAYMLSLIPHKPDWSEDDEKMENLIIKTLASMGTLNLERYYHMNLDEVKKWLKSLKDRVQSKQEWSEDDKLV